MFQKKLEHEICAQVCVILLILGPDDQQVVRCVIVTIVIRDIFMRDLFRLVIRDVYIHWRNKLILTEDFTQ